MRVRQASTRISFKDKDVGVRPAAEVLRHGSSYGCPLDGFTELFGRLEWLLKSGLKFKSPEELSRAIEWASKERPMTGGLRRRLHSHILFSQGRYCCCFSDDLKWLPKSGIQTAQGLQNGTRSACQHHSSLALARNKLGKNPKYDA